jgi:hypothetical protein
MSTKAYGGNVISFAVCAPLKILHLPCSVWLNGFVRSVSAATFIAQLPWIGLNHAIQGMRRIACGQPRNRALCHYVARTPDVKSI